MENNNFFSGEFNGENNTLDLAYDGERDLGDCIVSIKDLESNTCIFSFELNIFSGISFFCVPVPVDIFKFSDNRNFTAFKIEFYTNESMKDPYSELIIKLKPSVIRKKIPQVSEMNFDPTFFNYFQFFVDRIYDGMFSGQRINSVVDVGANFGLFSEWALDRFGSDTMILAIEPNPKAAKGFREMHKNRNNVILIEEAISDKDGVISLSLNPRNSLMSSFVLSDSNFTDNVEVKTSTLQSILDRNSILESDILKMDIEGAEYIAFESIGPELLRRFKNLIIEFHGNDGVKILQILNKIKEAGFSVDIRNDDPMYQGDEKSERGTIFATILR